MAGETKKTRSRFGCQACKKAKVKCNEARPKCSNCEKSGKQCDYSVKLVWGGRPFKKARASKMNPYGSTPEPEFGAAPMASSTSSSCSAATENPVFLVQVLSPPKPEEGPRKRRQEEPQPPPTKKKNHVHTVSQVLNSIAPENIDFSKVGFLNDLVSPLDSASSSSGSPASSRSVPVEGPSPAIVLPQQSCASASKTPSSVSSFVNEVLGDYAEDISHVENYTSSASNLIQVPLLNTADQRPSPRTFKSVYEEDDDELELVTPDTYAQHFHSPYPAPVESIPQGLLPLPDILLTVPYYWDLFRFFRDVTATVLVPTDVKIYRENPFKMVLPRMAICSDSVMTILLAFALEHKSYLLGVPSPKPIINQLISRTLKELLVLLQDDRTATGDLALTLVLMLSSFDLFSLRPQSWKIHIKGARQIFYKRGLQRPFDRFGRELISKTKNIGELTTLSATDPTVNRSESNLVYFLVRWYAYMDNIGMLSTPLEPSEDEVRSFLNQANPNNENWIVTARVDESLDYNFSAKPPSMEAHHNIDYFLGFNIKLLPVFAETVELIKKVNIVLSLSASPERKLPQSLVESAASLRAQFLEMIDWPPAPNDTVAELLTVNHLFIMTGLLNLYSRVFLLPKNSPVIQEICREILQSAAQYVTVGSPADLCLMVPYFSAGCFVEDPGSRQFCKTKLAQITSVGSGYAPKALTIMERVWETNKTWMQVMIDEKLNIVFL